jgi:ribosomal protein S18 acetylase RimI-like enzyme
MATWRPLHVSDIADLLRIASEIHPSLPESPAVFTERVELFPSGCYVLVEDSELCGYIISHPICQHQPPTLDSLLGEIASEADQYYIHDLAILPKMRGRGFAADIMDKISIIARRYQTTCLVSVYGTEKFWARFGFVTEVVDQGLAEKLREYGNDAIYLSHRNKQYSGVKEKAKTGTRT